MRKQLFDWGLLPEDAPKSQVSELGISIRKTLAHGQDPQKAIIRHLKKSERDLIVLATEGRQGWDRLRHPSIAASLSQSAGCKTLFLPRGEKGFVDPVDGKARIRRILIPVDYQPSPQIAVNTAFDFATALGINECVGITLHVGDEEGRVPFQFPQVEGWTWHKRQETGNVVDVISEFAESFDLIVMTTNGRHGLLDGLLGCTTERVVRSTCCPVLAVNAGED